MVQRKTVVYLHNSNGERTGSCQPEDIHVYMSRDEKIAYAVAVEGIVLENDHFQEYRTVYIVTREDHNSLNV